MVSSTGNGATSSRETLRNKLVSSPVGPVAAFPFRSAAVARHSGRVIARSLSWLLHERETMNFSYGLSRINFEHLAWFVSEVAQVPVEQTLTWMEELEGDQAFREHVAEGFRTNPQKQIGPRLPLWGRRVGWYALIRATRPQHVVETGTALGLGSCIMAAALIRNGTGRLTTIDSDPTAGHLVSGPWAEVIDRRVGDSVSLLPELGQIDFFLHDSLHTYDHEFKEFNAIQSRLSGSALVLSDNSQETLALSDWSRTHGRRFLFFKEIPENHWHTGEGIGLSW